jgi:hypothetical protein
MRSLPANRVQKFAAFARGVDSRKLAFIYGLFLHLGFELCGWCASQAVCDGLVLDGMAVGLEDVARRRRINSFMIGYGINTY